MTRAAQASPSTDTSPGYKRRVVLTIVLGPPPAGGGTHQTRGEFVCRLGQAHGGHGVGEAGGRGQLQQGDVTADGHHVELGVLANLQGKARTTELGPRICWQSAGCKEVSSFSSSPRGRNGPTGALNENSEASPIHPGLLRLQQPRVLSFLLLPQPLG